VEGAMIPGCYAVCEPHLARPRFLKCALVAGLAPAFSSEASAAPDPNQGVRRFIERYAITFADSWALVLAICGVRRGCRLNGKSAAAYGLRTCVRAQEVNNRRYLSIPAHIEVRSNMFLKTFLEAGVPSSEMFSCDGRVFQQWDPPLL
jgi:hypothetical protein